MSEPTTSGQEKTPEQKTSAELGKILVIIPTYNEAENIESIVGRLRSSVPGAHVLVADDNSPDGTGKLADALATALKARGVADLRAALAARTGMAAFVYATLSWLDDPEVGLGERIDLAFRELRTLLAEGD